MNSHSFNYWWEDLEEAHCARERVSREGWLKLDQDWDLNYRQEGDLTILLTIYYITLFAVKSWLFKNREMYGEKWGPVLHKESEGRM